jgi:predicted component of type VI protein secretion system
MGAHDDDDDDEESDIRRNLEFILGTKRGCGYLHDDFGLSDVSYRTPEEAVVTLSREIEENIRLYEPRVRLIRIKEVYDEHGIKVKLDVVLERQSDRGRMNVAMDLAKRRSTVAEP